VADLLEQMRHNPYANWNIGDVEKVCAEHGVTCAPLRGGESHYKVSHQRFKAQRFLRWSEKNA